eukprot:2167561-Prymnesium_polylepis.2
MQEGAAKPPRGRGAPIRVELPHRLESSQTVELSENGVVRRAGSTARFGAKVQYSVGARGVLRLSGIR